MELVLLFELACRWVLHNVVGDFIRALLYVVITMISRHLPTYYKLRAVHVELMKATQKTASRFGEGGFEYLMWEYYLVHYSVH